MDYRDVPEDWARNKQSTGTESNTHFTARPQGQHTFPVPQRTEGGWDKRHFKGRAEHHVAQVEIRDTPGGLPSPR